MSTNTNNTQGTSSNVQTTATTQPPKKATGATLAQIWELLSEINALFLTVSELNSQMTISNTQLQATSGLAAADETKNAAYADANATLFKAIGDLTSAAVTGVGFGLSLKANKSLNDQLSQQKSDIEAMKTIRDEHFRTNRNANAQAGDLRAAGNRNPNDYYAKRIEELKNEADSFSKTSIPKPPAVPARPPGEYTPQEMRTKDSDGTVGADGFSNSVYDNLTPAEWTTIKPKLDEQIKQKETEANTTTNEISSNWTKYKIAQDFVQSIAQAGTGGGTYYEQTVAGDARMREKQAELAAQLAAAGVNTTAPNINNAYNNYLKTVQAFGEIAQTKA